MMRQGGTGGGRGVSYPATDAQHRVRAVRVVCHFPKSLNLDWRCGCCDPRPYPDRVGTSGYVHGHPTAPHHRTVVTTHTTVAVREQPPACASHQGGGRPSASGMGSQGAAGEGGEPSSAVAVLGASSSAGHDRRLRTLGTRHDLITPTRRGSRRGQTATLGWLARR